MEVVKQKKKRKKRKWTKRHGKKKRKEKKQRNPRKNKPVSWAGALPTEPPAARRQKKRRRDKSGPLGTEELLSCVYTSYLFFFSRSPRLAQARLGRRNTPSPPAAARRPTPAAQVFVVTFAGDDHKPPHQVCPPHSLPFLLCKFEHRNPNLR